MNFVEYFFFLRRTPSVEEAEDAAAELERREAAEQVEEEDGKEGRVGAFCSAEGFPTLQDVIDACKE